MADKKAEITPIDLKGSINLNSMRSEVMDYASGSYNEKNSLFYGNKLNTWYKGAIPQDAFRQYKGKPITINSNGIMYDGKLYSITGKSIKLEEVDYDEDYNLSITDIKAFIRNNSLYLKTKKSDDTIIENKIVESIPYSGYPSIRTQNSFWTVSIIPDKPRSILDCVTYYFYFDTQDNKNRLQVSGLKTYKYCIVDAEVGYCVRVEDNEMWHRTVKFGPISGGISNFDSIFNSCAEVDIQFIKEEKSYVSNFTIAATKHYLQCTYDTLSRYYTFGSNHKDFIIRKTGFFYQNKVLFDNYTDGYRADIMLYADDKALSWWAGGIKIPLYSNNNVYKFDVLYNHGGILEGISRNNSLITRDVDEICVVGDDYIIYSFNNKYYKISLAEQNYEDCFIVKNYLCLNTDSYLNTINLDNGEMFCRSDDYNNRIFPTLNLPFKWTGLDGEGNPVTYEEKINSRGDDYYYLAIQSFNNSQDTHYTSENYSNPLLFVSGVNEMYYSDNTVNPSTIETPVTVVGSVPTGYGQGTVPSSPGYKFEDIIERFDTLNPYEIPDNQMVDVFFPIVQGGVPIYDKSIGTGKISTSLSKGVTKYPIDTNNNTFYNPTVLDTIKETYLNQAIIITPNYSTVTVLNNKLNMVFGYYLFSMVEFNDVFIMQGSYYACNSDYIVRLNLENGVMTNAAVVANKKDFQFIGSTTNEALFFSPFDRSVYSFAGDFNLRKMIETTSINEVYEVYNNPAISVIALSSDIGLIVFYQGQICLLEDLKDRIVYYDDKCIINGHTKLSFDKRDNFVKIPVILESELYGVGSEVKSINDCLYIRLYSEDMDSGKVVISSRTLNEITAKSEKKEIKINSGSWDKSSGTMFIRYQPKNQAATGFSFRIESDFPVASVSLSHKPETVQNSTYNL